MAPRQPYLDPAEERRLVLRVLAYWQDIRADRIFPDLGDIDEGFIGADWAQCLILMREGNAWKPTRIGEALQAAEGAAGLPAGLWPVLDELIARLLAKRVPISLGRDFSVAGQPCLGRAIVLPLAAGGDDIGAVLAAVNWKVDEAKAGDRRS